MRIDADTLRSHGGQQSWNGQRRKLFPWSLFYGFAHANVGFLSSNSESVSGILLFYPEPELLIPYSIVSCDGDTKWYANNPPPPPKKKRFVKEKVLTDDTHKPWC